MKFKSIKKNFLENEKNIKEKGNMYFLEIVIKEGLLTKKEQKDSKNSVLIE